MNKFKEMDKAVSELSTKLSEDACDIVVAKWQELKDNIPDFEEVWEHLEKAKDPSTMEILAGKVLRIYARRVYDFIMKDKK